MQSMYLIFNYMYMYLYALVDSVLSYRTTFIEDEYGCNIYRRALGATFIYRFFLHFNSKFRVMKLDVSFI